MGLFSSTEPLNIRPEDINSEVGTLLFLSLGQVCFRDACGYKTNNFSELMRYGLSHGTDVWLNNARILSE